MSGHSFIADADFTFLKAFVIKATGMVFYADKDEDLARILDARMREVGDKSCASYLLRLREPESGTKELDDLISELTIGETYFFRHSEQFDALRQTILPDIIARNHTTKRLRIWSAGCSIGAEPYSLAIMLHDEFSRQLAGWSVGIIATDINRKFLARAARGVYEPWAFRLVPEDIKTRCFEPVGRTLVLREEYKRLVSFRYHNMVTDIFPSANDGLAALDIIICRNVIIYFDAETIKRLVGQFRETLVDGGWLIMGHAEPNIELFRDFKPHNAPGAVLYQKMDRPPEEAKRPSVFDSPSSISAKPAHHRHHPPPVKRQEEPKPKPPAPAQPSPKKPEAPVAATKSGFGEIKQLADRGEWKKAAAACAALMASEKLNPRLHYYQALIAEHLGNIGDCEQSLRRAIFLDRSFVLSHYHLGLLLGKRGDKAGAAKSFRNAHKLLEGLPEGLPIEDDGGISVGELRQMIAVRLSVLGEAQ
jgi:chemotaxis protein methyltransferase CheR